MRLKLNRGILKWISTNSGKIKISIIILVVIQSIMGMFGVCYSWNFRNIIDRAVEHNVEGFWSSAVFLVFLLLLQILLGALNRFLVENTKSTLENKLKDNLFKAILSKDFSCVTAIHSGEWMNRFTSDTAIVANGTVCIVPELFGMIIKLICATIMLVYIIPHFAYAILPATFVIIFLTYFFRKKLKNLHKLIQEADGKLREFVSERLSSLVMIKSFSKEAYVDNIAKEKMSEHKSKRMKRNHFSNICTVSFSVLMGGAYILSSIYCGYGILIDTISYGTFVAILQLISQIQTPFANISGCLPQYYATIASAERLSEIEAYPDDSQSSNLTKSQINNFYNNDLLEIKFEKLYFSYNINNKTSNVFENVSLCIKKGEYVALTGASGCGKSTILKLMMSIYKPYSGKNVLISKNSEIENVSSYRKLYAYVPQGNNLMSGSIRQVITFGDYEKENDDEFIWSTLKIACAYEFVIKLKDGIDTQLGENGSGLSEGQMQRIAIARAIASGRPILLLDECTSSLDEATEKMLLKNLRSMTNCTVVIVTHRKKSLEICDRQLIVSQNCIIEEKKHHNI